MEFYKGVKKKQEMKSWFDVNLLAIGSHIARLIIAYIHD